MEDNKLTKFDMLIAFIEAASVLFHKESVSAKCRELEASTGLTIWTQWTAGTPYADIVVDEKVFSLLRKLQGPHGKTILKAYQVKHDIRKH